MATIAAVVRVHICSVACPCCHVSVRVSGARICAVLVSDMDWHTTCYRRADMGELDQARYATVLLRAATPCRCYVPFASIFVSDVRSSLSLPRVRHLRRKSRRAGRDTAGTTSTSPTLRASSAGAPSAASRTRSICTCLRECRYVHPPPVHAMVHSLLTTVVCTWLLH